MESVILNLVSWNMEGIKNVLIDEDFVNFVQNFDLIFCSETWQMNNENY